MKSPDRIPMILAVSAFAFAVDQSTKWLIVNEIMRPPRTIELTGFLNIVLGMNTGVSFGLLGELFADRQVLLAGIKLAIVAGLVFFAWQSESAPERTGFSLMVGGALGNIIDRWRQGGVTDFIDFHWNGWHWPAFNMADVAITLGVGFVILSTFGSAPRRSRGIK